MFSACYASAAETDSQLPSSVFCPQSCILTGKASLDMGDYEKALVYLTAAYEEMPFLGDYILFWRAGAFAGKSESAKALEDLAAIRKRFPDSPLLRSVRMKEIEILQKDGATNMEDLFQKFLADYPSDNKARFTYAVYLKNSNKKERARTLFREIFSSVSSYAKSAGEELTESDIRTADLMKKGKSLNNAWLFKDAEKYFRKALLKKDSGPLKKDINEGLALALFRQKKYREAAVLYSECNDSAGRARSLFRAGDWEGFDREIGRMVRQNDSRASSLMIAYGSKKRRSGNSETAISIFNEVISRFPAAKEDALWQKGWTHYRAGNYQQAVEIFESLYKTYGQARYLYWKNRSLEISGTDATLQQISHIPNDRSNNFYFLMSALRGKGAIPSFETNGSDRCSGYALPKRIEVLDALGFKKEAASEISKTANKSAKEQDITCLSSYLYKKGDFKTSINLAVRLPFREELHDLYYPLAYLDLVEEAARDNNLDPLLILSIMREESRFASDARSVAGALGLMQLMPQTASKISKRAKVSLGRSEELYDARTNVFIGSYYLSMLIRHFGSAPPAIASYNAGEEIVKEWLSSGGYMSMDEFVEDIPYDETRNYVKKVMTSYLEYLRQQGNKEMPALLIKAWNL
jgi:soluble lytic murein transglycosylase